MIFWHFYQKKCKFYIKYAVMRDIMELEKRKEENC